MDKLNQNKKTKQKTTGNLLTPELTFEFDVFTSKFPNTTLSFKSAISCAKFAKSVCKDLMRRGEEDEAGRSTVRSNRTRFVYPPLLQGGP